MLACGLFSCVVRRPVDLRPSELLALNQCLAEVGAPPPQESGSPECVRTAWHFLLELEARATCRSDRDCDDVFLWGSLGVAQPAFVAVNRVWWESKGQAEAERLKCAFICGGIGSWPRGAVCRRNRCELVQDSYLLPYATPEAARCAKRFAWRRELPAWP